VWSGRKAAVGCADLTGSVDGGWVRRDGDTTTVSCNNTDETWYLACRDGRWVGNVTGCGTGGGNTPTGKITTDNLATAAAAAAATFVVELSYGEKQDIKCHTTIDGIFSNDNCHTVRDIKILLPCYLFR